MKRIIYNSKLKKIIMLSIIFMLLFNFMFPHVIIATEIPVAVVGDPVKTEMGQSYYEVKGTIQEVINSLCYSRNYLGSDVEKHTIADKITKLNVREKHLENLEYTVKVDIEIWIDNNFSDIVSYVKNNNLADFSNITDEDEIKELCFDKIYNDNCNDKSKIEVTCYLVSQTTSLGVEWRIEGGKKKEGVLAGKTGFTSEVKLTVQEVKNTLAKSLEEIGEVQAERGQQITKEDDGVVDSDIGGILLSPVFYLINFIADAITGNLGFIMAESDLVTGIGVLSRDVTPPKTGRDYYEYKVDTSWNALGGIQYPTITYTPEEIFTGKIDLLSIDFISGKTLEKDENGDLVYRGENGNIVENPEYGSLSYVDNPNSGWTSVRNVIASWYKVLRMIAIIGLLSVLIYTGIKIMISANAKDKAKFKEWIINWFMAVAILFFMHYIMAFIISVTGEFSQLIGNASQGIKIINTSTNEESVTNLMGLVRFMIQSEDFYMKVGYEVMYIALIVYTIKFTIVYLKRVLNMAFLTLIAPIVALIYPIDKINDGQAQGFNMWLKEYIFNALLQPMHCIMYYVLVGSAVGIAADNPIYGIVVLAFMTEAEKLLKKIFGFDKAGGGTVGGMAGAFAAGAIASNVKNIARLASGGKGGKGGSGADKDSMPDNPKPTDKPGMEEVFSDDQSNTRDDKANQQAMLDADDDKYNTEEWDAQQRDALAREASQDDGGKQYSEDEYRQILMDSNPDMTEEELEEAMIDGGYGPSNEQDSGEGQDDGQNSGEGKDDAQNSGEGQDDAQNSGNGQDSDNKLDDGKTIREKASVARGLKAVGKRLAKPVWDFDKSKSYNGKRLLKAGGRAVVGATIGTAAAAVQAGISITDGKYSLKEGALTFAAGYAGGGVLTRGMGSLVDTYREGSLPEDKKERNREIMERAKAKFADRDDVIAFNKKNFAGREDVVQRERDNYLETGITDLKEMKNGIKYADTMVGKTDGLSAEQIEQKRREADRKAAATINFRKTLQEQGQLKAVYDQDKQDKYINSMVSQAEAEGKDTEKVRKQYENAFKAVAAYDAANA